MNDPSEAGERRYPVLKRERSKLGPDADQPLDDWLAIEEPMEIRLGFGPRERRETRSLSITMRTPGHDFELAAGFLHTEAVIRSRDEIERIEFCGPAVAPRASSNIVRVELTADVEVKLKSLERNFYTTSSCGICGKASLDAVEVEGIEPLPQVGVTLAHQTLPQLPERLRISQPSFERTGGIHAAALVDSSGGLHAVREDVGRHNAVDKLIGYQLLQRDLPLHRFAMLVSGRASFEILQKALVAGIPMIVAVGAPSSLAVDLANRFGMTLVGFTSAHRYNVYSGVERIIDR
jgi:FdhD protein